MAKQAFYIYVFITFKDMNYFSFNTKSKTLVNKGIDSNNIYCRKYGIFILKSLYLMYSHTGIIEQKKTPIINFQK